MGAHITRKLVVLATVGAAGGSGQTSEAGVGGTETLAPGDMETLANVYARFDMQPVSGDGESGDLREWRAVPRSWVSMYSQVRGVFLLEEGNTNMTVIWFSDGQMKTRTSHPSWGFVSAFPHMWSYS